MPSETTRQLAEKIALLLQGNEKESDDFSIIRASLEKINARLDKIEDKINFQTVQPLPITLQPSTSHPSREKFTNLEELADEIISRNLQNEKACPYEPSSKPCDHCAMCNSRGF